MRGFASSRAHEPSRRRLLAELRECRSLKRGKELHAVALESGDGCCLYVATALVRMYAKCGSLVDARRVFDGLKHPDAVSWTALISGYANNGESFTALDLFERMKSRGCAPDRFTFVAALNACTSLAVEKEESEKAECLELGRKIHLESSCYCDMFVLNALVDMYAKCGSMVEARKVFDSIENPDTASWNTLILGYAANGEGSIALNLLERMKFQGCEPNHITFVAALKACTSLAVNEEGKAESLCRGRCIHREIGSHLHISVQTTLIDMYANCGSMAEARQVFDSMKNPNVVSWTALILGYAENRQGVAALDLFDRMNCEPNNVTFVAALKACTSLLVEQDGCGKSECLMLGKRLHSQIGGHSDVHLQNTLIDMYSKCGSMSDARQVFDNMQKRNVVSWTALILGYVKNGEAVSALDLFARMRTQGFAPHSVTLVAALKACALLGAWETGSRIYAEFGAECDATVVTCLVDFYARCGSLVEARKIFDSHPNARDITTWNALLAGYSRLGDSKAGFELFQQMQDAGLQPNEVTFSCLLSCCSHAGSVEKASEFFEVMQTKFGVTATAEHYNCMVDILGRSNKLDDAVALLKSMPCRADSVTWLTVLGVCLKWKNVGVGKLAFRSLISLDDTNAAAYVLMARIYGSKGMWEEQEMLLGMRGCVGDLQE